MSTEQTSTPMDDGQQSNQFSPNIGESNLGGDNCIPVNISQEVEVHGSTEVESGGSRKLTSYVWNHFKRQKIDGKWKAVCNYCEKRLLGDSKQGTSHLRSHFSSCQLRTTRDIRQAILKTQKVGGESVIVGNYVFNQETARRALLKMIILHEYPMSMVDHIGFKDFCAALQPLFKGISRNTLRSDIMKEFHKEKEITMKLFSKNPSRIAITTDMWTASNQNKGYMTVTAHFIDDSWTLQSRLVRFIYVPAPHTSVVLAEVLVQCLMDWNLDRKVSTVTVDNCTTNDAMIERILEKISPRSLIVGGQLFHMRCCAHILNLIVRDGLSVISTAIEKVRESVSYWTATPKREEKFIETCSQVNVSFNRKLVLDCKTRWNSTFLMLQVALQYKDVFERLSQRESQYKSLPSEYDWEMASHICQRLEIFYDVTLLFSSTSYPTTNIFFPKMCEMKLALMDCLNSPNSVIHEMAVPMIAKFDKYWGVINGVMAIGIVLDPRYKIDLLDYFYPQIYGDDSDYHIGRVKSICQDLVRDYEIKMKGKRLDSSNQSSNLNLDGGFVGKNDDWKKGFAKHKIAKKSEPSNYKSELDSYLEEETFPDSNDFDILVWWKANGLKYPILQMIARDCLAVPISTVASESSFSTGGRFITPHRSRLLPETIEALMCLQDWLWADMEGSSGLKEHKMKLNSVLEELEDEDESTGPSGITREEDIIH